ncbi:hypothetical protein IAU60_000043 [Kwoniella sp. DSM 27419]
MRLSYLVCVAVLAQVYAPPWSQSTANVPAIRGQYVPYNKLHTCPRLSRRDPPRSAKDVRPDDFRVVMALGDSITAGLLARGSRDDHQMSFEVPNQPLWPANLPEIAEWRGVSYPIGADPDAITIHNIISHYVRRHHDALLGGSKGHHAPLGCLINGVDVGCFPRPKKDGLNAAISGSVSASLINQVTGHIIPALQAMEVNDSDWKLVNLAIGANDICAFCLTPNVTTHGVLGTPQEFAAGIRNAVEELRKNVPNVIVNIIGMFRVSAIYKLTLADPYCQTPGLPLPHLALECGCALLPGPAGDYTRQKMDEQGEAYDQAVQAVVEQWQEEHDPSFGVIWQPGTAVDLERWPIEALSPIDCFHPSEMAHQRVAVGFWNRLTREMKEKSLPIEWEDVPMIRCLEEGDRVLKR